MTKVAISGYFDPVHIGHIDLMKRARKLGDYLIVIVNNDFQAKLKKGRSFMSEKERVEIIKSLKFVDEVVLSIDMDRTVRKTLELVKPDIFANGGDRITDEDVPEKEICDKFGIRMMNNLGEKLQSSSNLTGLVSVGKKAIV
ncbi:MAG: adenylyltransferase/cytidyltransferase family protein [Nanoarchaeota archaeon]|nr:adenylyltransferase/cytidyltransferase family protein [Nanoarchaeota archaeon]